MIGKRIASIINGKYTFTAVNGFGELFFSECRKQGAKLHNLIVLPEGVKAECEESEREKVEKAAKLSGLELIESKRTGLPYLREKYAKRKGIATGAILGVAIFVFLSSFIWETDVTGNVKITDETVLSFLETENVRVGSFKPGIDAYELAYEIEKNINGVAWAAVNIRGCKLTVELREALPKPSIGNKNQYCNIVASQSGEIVRADVYTGAGTHLPGEPVVKGDMLVSGVVNLVEGCRFVRADADITARTRTVLSLSCRSDREILKLKKCKDIYLLRFFHLSVPLGIGVKSDALTSEAVSATSRYSVYPIGISRKRFTLFEESSEKADRNRMLLRVFADFTGTYFDRYINSEIIELNVELTDKTGMTITAESVCIENIVEKKEFYILNEKND